MSKTRLSRRNFLHAIGASAALVPLLEMDNEAKGATPARRRMVTAAWTNGFWRQDLWPSGEGETYQLNSMLKPLEPYKKWLMVVGGVKLQNFLDTRGKKNGDPGAGHDAYPTVFVGEPMAEYADGVEKSGGDSIDQYVADRLNAGTPFKNLVVGGMSGSGYGSTTSYKGAGSSGVTPESDPSRLFKTLFEGRSLPKGEIDKAFLRRASILDHLGSDLDKFATRVGTTDRMRIQQHAESIRELEKQITALANGPQCTAPPGINVGGGKAEYGKEDGQYPARLGAQVKLIAAALKCDLTRVVNFTMEDNGGDIVMSFLGSEFAGGGDEFPTRTHHDIAHNRKKSAAHAARYSRVSQWFFEHIAALAKELSMAGEGGGSVLDSTMIAVSSPMHHNHTVVGIPFVFIGGSWYFKTNRFVKLGPWKGTSGGVEGPVLNDDGWWSKNEATLPAHNGILVGMANAMGVPTTNFGPAKYGGEFPELRG